MLLASIVIAVAAVPYTLLYVYWGIRYRRALRNGERAQGEVVDLEVRRTGRYGYFVRPIVRYRVGGRDYVGTVINRRKRPDLQRRLDVVVEAHAPERPWSLYESSIAVNLTYALVLDAIALVLFLLALR